MNRNRTVILGDPVIEIVTHGIRYPNIGEEAEIKSIYQCGGGSGTNFASFLGWLGGKTGLIGRVGKDNYGDEIIRELTDSGVDISYVIRDDTERTGLCILYTTPDGQWTAFVYRGAYAKLTDTDIDPSYIKTAKRLHIPGFALLSENQKRAASVAIQFAQKSNVEISLDPCWPIVTNQREYILTLLPLCKNFFPNKYEALHLVNSDNVEEAALKILEFGPELVAIKLGSDGCYVKHKKTAFYQPGYEVDVIDTTGAGDAFAAAFTYGLDLEWSLQKCAQFANATAAFVCTYPGSRSKQFSKADIDRLLSKTL